MVTSRVLLDTSLKWGEGTTFDMICFRFDHFFLDWCPPWMGSKAYWTLVQFSFRYIIDKQPYYCLICREKTSYIRCLSCSWFDVSEQKADVKTLRAAAETFHILSNLHPSDWSQEHAKKPFKPFLQTSRYLVFSQVGSKQKLLSLF